ncbi:hypothetical protein VTN77DRAFT_3175 [Rasamsonia byssochlamydoides]|uniref:uncharacterized protein n=1 Tax=Rasamsonia byssochlamydoides TaxID=89139 RepID=UPI00374365DE
MLEQGFTVIQALPPPEGMAEAIKNAVGIQNLSCEALDNDEPTRHWRGGRVSLATNRVFNSCINVETYIYQTFLGIRKDDGRSREPGVVCTNHTRKARPYLLGPQGHSPNTAVSVILSLGDPKNNFFYYYKSSHLLTREEFKQQAGTLTKERYFFSVNQAVVMSSELWVEFPTEKGGCWFICKTYSLGVPQPSSGPDLSEDYRSEEDIVPFMRIWTERREAPA